ncbi:MAG: DUF6873 family GME fold protein [Bacteroidales bacterium]
MYILIDHRIPDEAKKNLSAYGQLIEFKSNSITYNTIASHPDIYCCQTPDQLIIAPNTPSDVIDSLFFKNIQYVVGNQFVGSEYPYTSHYNAVVTKDFLIHNIDNTERKIVEFCTGKKTIKVKQGYTRCNLIAIKNTSFITSDKGIYKQMKTNMNISALYVNPDKIILTDQKNGFFGGCCGIFRNKLFIIGSLNFLEHGVAVKEFTLSNGIEIIELYNGPLYDGGSIFFIESKSNQLD